MPAAPAVPKVVKHVTIVTEHGDHAKGDKHDRKMFEKRIEKDGKTIVIRSDKPISEVELEQKLARIETIEVPDAPLPPGAPGERRREVRKFVLRDGADRESHAMAMVMSHCRTGTPLADVDAGDESNADGKTTVSRTKILICGNEGESGAQALAHVRAARDRVAGNDSMSVEVRSQVLQKLDEAIARLETQGK
jgi:hypothetical protein